MKSLLLILVLTLFCLANPMLGQIQDPVSSNPSDTIGQDDFGLFNESNKNTFRVLFSGKPGRAALYSLILPGAGQYYNKRYWKIPIVYAGIGTVSYFFWFRKDSFGNNVSIQQQYIDIKALYEGSFGTDQESIYYNYYLQAKKSREQMIFAFIGVHLFNVFDAYIDRHLIDFDMSDDLSLHFRPYPDGISPVGISLSYQLD